jgi:aspartate aminotransferase
MQACVDDGDEVAIFAPYWTSYPEQVKLAGGNPVIVPAAEADGFVPSAGALEKALTPRSRAVIVNSPSNPTGAVIPRAEWEGIAELAAARGLLLVCDEVYEDFVYGGGAYVSGTAFLPRLKEQLVIVNSFSKPYAMTGWRVGYALGPRALIGAAATVQMHDASQAPSISQHAALAALTGPQEPLREMVAEFAMRREYLIPALRSIPGVTCAMPEGAFYAFPGVTGLYGRLGVTSSEEVAMLLLREAHVVTVPGEGFGAPGYIRLSYAASLAELQDAVARIGAFVAGRGA